MEKVSRLLKRHIPRRLRTGDFPYTSVLYTLVFSIVFMFLYRPFSSSAWFSLTSARIAGLTVLFFAGCVVLLCISKALFIRFCSTRAAKLWQFILWSIAEFIAIALLYVGFTEIFALGDYHTAGSLILKTVCCVMLILLIPYSVIFAVTDSLQSKETPADDSRNATEKQQSSTDPVNSLKERMINFTDDSGVLRFSVDVDSILYIKSEGNYVNLYYEKGDGVASYMMRIPIGSLETRLAGTPLLRCQRSYIVNTRRIRMMQNDGKATYIILDNDSVPVIPMSHSYTSSISRVLTGI